jgi:tRNA (adenine57-N1/adenine58-N1)-methyltransferase
VDTKRKTAQAGDLIQLVGLSHKNFIFRLSPGSQLQTHRGVVKHDDLIDIPWGSKISSHLGRPFYLFQPALGDILLETRRTTQIMYPKDIGFIVITMGIGPGQHFVEAGTGSGALTTALAFAVGDQGHITTYEVRPDMQKLAKNNLVMLGLDKQVTFKLKDIESGFDETDVDGLFLDLQNPEDYIPQVRSALKPGGRFGSILPTVNQVSRLIRSLEKYNFAFIEVCEIILRYYKPVPQRLRPTDRMVAHTGYLVFARQVFNDEQDSDVEIEHNSLNTEDPSK